jgi:hypothetical protein
MDWTAIGALIGAEGVKYVAAAASLFLAGWKSCERILVKPERSRVESLQAKLESLETRIHEKFWGGVQ